MVYGKTLLSVFAYYDPIIVVENVAAIRSRGLDRVLGELGQVGCDASWTSLRASDVGAPHRRERVFILTYRPEAADLLAMPTPVASAMGGGGQPVAKRRAGGHQVDLSDLTLLASTDRYGHRGMASSVGEIAGAATKLLSDTGKQQPGDERRIQLSAVRAGNHA